MSNFSTAFQQALADLSIQRQEFAKKVGVSPSQISGYAGATVPVGNVAIARVCGALPMPQRGLVLRGYLLDQIPEGSESAVKIDVQTDSQPDPRHFPAMDDELYQAVSYLVGRAIHEKPFRYVLLDMYDVARGPQPGQNAGRLREDDDPLFLGETHTDEHGHVTLILDADERGTPEEKRARAERALDEIAGRERET